jgi:stress-induced-phosphoprotein 1
MPKKKKGKKKEEDEGNTPQSHKDRGNAAVAKKQYAVAVQHYTLAIEEDPGNHVLYSNRSAAHLGIGSDEAFNAALGDANTCITAVPSWPKVSSRICSVSYLV